MCRKYQAAALGLIGFGCGILVGGWIGGCVLRFLTALVCAGLGILLLGGKHRHK